MTATDCLIELAKRVLAIDVKIIALRSLLVQEEVISLEQFDRCLAEISAGAAQLTKRDLDSQLLDLLKEFEGPVQ